MSNKITIIKHSSPILDPEHIDLADHGGVDPAAKNAETSFPKITESCPSSPQTSNSTITVHVEIVKT